MSDIDLKGRKFMALILAACILLFIIICMVGLALFDKTVPLALGICAGTLASCFPGYLGVNVYQKKLETKRVADE